MGTGFDADRPHQGKHAVVFSGATRHHGGASRPAVAKVAPVPFLALASLREQEHPAFAGSGARADHLRRR